MRHVYLQILGWSLVSCSFAWGQVSPIPPSAEGPSLLAPTGTNSTPASAAASGVSLNGTAGGNASIGNAPQEASPATLGAPIEPNSAPTDLRSKRIELARRLSVAQRVLESSQASTAEGVLPSERSLREVELLKQLDIVYSQQQAAVERNDGLLATRNEIQAKLNLQTSASAYDSGEPSFILLDRERDELEAVERRKGNASSLVTSALEAHDKAHAIQSQCERERRQAKEKLDTNRDVNAAGALQAAVKQAELESQLAAETVRLREAEVVNEKNDAALHELRLQYLRRRVADLTKSARFTQHDLEEQLLEMNRRETALRSQLERAQSDLNTLEQNWHSARKKLEENGQLEAALTEEVETWRLARQCRQQEVTVLSSRLQRAALLSSAWKRRFEAANSAVDSARTRVWVEEARRSREELDRQWQAQSMRVVEFRSDLATLAHKMFATAGNPKVAKWVDAQQKHVLQLIQVYDSDLVSIENSRRMVDRLLEELGSEKKGKSLTESAGDTLRVASAIWSYELTSVDDKPITVKKIVSGVLLLAIGYLLSLWISRWFGRRLLPKLRVHENAASALQSLAFYMLVCMFTLFALHLVNVPLTVFTVLGGALAIGVGFGSQNIANNFISGLILLAERPVRVGDTIQIDGLQGSVESIGARSTRLRTENNLEIIVPNSAFLENNVVNLTLSDDRVRTQIHVGVAYGSNTRRVAQLLRQAAEEFPEVLRDPRPGVFFKDFGDNSLNFELNFWMRLKSIDHRRELESEIRHTIDELFRESGIVISFPQRDIHIDTTSPIQVALLNAAALGGARQAAA